MPPISPKRTIAPKRRRVWRGGGDYPLLSGGDVNIYSLFVERAMALVKPDGMVGLLTPSGIASDKTASVFFKGVATEGRLKALYDFENKATGRSFPMSSRIQVLRICCEPERTAGPAQCAFFLPGRYELANPERRFPLTPKTSPG